MLNSRTSHQQLTLLSNVPIHAYGLWDAVNWFEVYTYLLALLICCGTLKFIRRLRFNSHVYALTRTIKKSAKPVVLFTVMAGIVLMAFTQMGNLLFGTRLQDYKNVPTSLQSLCIAWLQQAKLRGLPPVEVAGARIIMRYVHLPCV
ncbi:hypothetical protein Bbelb_065850 [Branchiostoma belcheri]|nr:hypothetical protein Bbelb_065850 [Branchiostoma belcheri]